MADSKGDKTKGKNKNDVIYKNYVLNKIGITMQIVLVGLVLIFAVVSIFNPSCQYICTLFTGLALLVMAYNNYKIYKRKSFTMVYIIVGVLVLIFTVLDLIK